MLIKKTLILASLVAALSVLLALWMFDKLMVLNGRDSGYQFFTRPEAPLNDSPAKLQFQPLRRSA
ncbi:MAG: hypothetical protein FVQ81_10835 [Candidatus Glassbacteria bacterium]|nr:hypothetical protein [Candidatus Glassbacteria bacterium]